MWPLVAIGVVVVLLVAAAIYALMPSSSGSDTGSIHVDVNGARESGEVLVTGHGFKANEMVDILLDGVLVGSSGVDADGTFSTMIPIGSSTSGTVDVEGQSSGHSASSDFSVRTFPSSPSAESSDVP